MQRAAVASRATGTAAAAPITHLVVHGALRGPRGLRLLVKPRGVRLRRLGRSRLGLP